MGRYANRFSLLAVVLAICVAGLYSLGITPKMLGDYVGVFNVLVSAIAGFLLRHENSPIEASATRGGRPIEPS